MHKEIEVITYYGAISLAIQIVENGKHEGQESEIDFIKKLLCWVWDKSTSVDLKDLEYSTAQNLEIITCLLLGGVQHGKPVDHPNAEYLHQNSACQFTQPIIDSPEGDYYRVENEDSFTPTNKKIALEYVQDKNAIASLRRRNLDEGRMLNHGMPFSEEEAVILKRKVKAGKSVDALSDFFQRSPFSIEKRLEELGLIGIAENAIETSKTIASVANSGNQIYCEDCDEEIPLARLQAMQSATLCINCASSKESKLDTGVKFPNVPKGLQGKCPRCEKGVAVVYQNHTDKNFFVGCSTFPSCRWSAQMKEDSWYQKIKSALDG